jgi:type I restriction enzyme M protein
MPATASTIAEIEAEDYNCNIRRYVDNADFAPAVTDRRALAGLVKADPGMLAAHGRFLETLDSWWAKNLALVEALAPLNGAKGNVYELRRQLLASIAAKFADQNLLTDHQVRGAFARYMNDLKADLKSIAASGFGAELIPEGELLESQFPELLAEMEQKRLRVAELTAMFTAAEEEDFEDSDDTGLPPADEVKTLKAQLRELNAPTFNKHLLSFTA